MTRLGVVAGRPRNLPPSAAFAALQARKAEGRGMPWRKKVSDYRQRAEELRAVAESLKDEAVRQMLAKLAEDYESMAVGLERANSPP